MAKAAQKKAAKHEQPTNKPEQSAATVDNGNRLADYGEALEAAIKRVGMPNQVAEELREEWADFCKERAKDDPEEVRFELELFPTRLGGLVIVLEPEGKELLITVKMVDPDTEAELVMYPLPEETWEAILPEPQRKAERREGPNAPCPCGSGKKFKKCCASKE